MQRSRLSFLRPSSYHGQNEPDVCSLFKDSETASLPSAPSAPPCWRPPGRSHPSPRRSTEPLLSGCPPVYARRILCSFATTPTAALCVTTARSGSYNTGTRAWWWTLVVDLRLSPLIGLCLLMWTFPGHWSWLSPHAGAVLPCPAPNPLSGCPRPR